MFPAYRSIDGATDKGERRMHYRRMYINYVRDYQSLSSHASRGNLLHQLTVLMLNPDHVARPTAESLLTLISLKSGGMAQIDPGIPGTSGSETRPVVVDLLGKLIHKVDLKLEPEIIRLSHRIIKVIQDLIELNSDLYLTTVLWMASKIVLGRAYEPKVLGLSLSSILTAERTICNTSRFKFCII